MIIESTSDLSILHASRSIRERAGNESWLAQPSWVLDFRSCTWSINPFKTSKKTHFTPDGDGLVAEGIKIGALVVHWVGKHVGSHMQEALEGTLRDFYSVFVSSTASSSDHSVDEVWRDWLRLVIKLFGWDSQTHNLSADECFMGLLGRVRTDQMVPPFLTLVLLYDYCAYTLDNRYVDDDGSSPFTIALAKCTTYNTLTSCLTPGRGTARPVEIWALRGAAQCSLLQPSLDGKSYRNVGWIQITLDCKGRQETWPLNEKFFSSKTMETITIRSVVVFGMHPWDRRLAWDQSDFSRTYTPQQDMELLAVRLEDNHRSYLTLTSPTDADDSDDNNLRAKISQPIILSSPQHRQSHHPPSPSTVLVPYYSSPYSKHQGDFSSAPPTPSNSPPLPS